MSFLAILSVESVVLYTFLMLIMVMIASSIGAILSYLIGKIINKINSNIKPLGVSHLGFILSLMFTLVYISSNDVIQGVVHIDQDTSIEIDQYNQFMVTYKTYQSIEKGHDLDGKLISSKKAILNKRVIICEKDGKTIGYKDCWNMLKNKSSDELVAISHQFNVDHPVTLISN